MKKKDDAELINNNYYSVVGIKNIINNNKK